MAEYDPSLAFFVETQEGDKILVSKTSAPQGFELVDEQGQIWIADPQNLTVHRPEDLDEAAEKARDEFEIIPDQEKSGGHFERQEAAVIELNTVEESDGRVPEEVSEETPPDENFWQGQEKREGEGETEEEDQAWG